MKRFLGIGIGIIIVTNIFIFSNVIANRSMGEKVTLTLSDRELRVPYQYGLRKEDSSLIFDLRWRILQQNSALYYYNRRQEISPARIEELGFELPRRKGQYETTHKLSKEIFWLVEFNGSAYQQTLTRAENELKKARLELLNKKSEGGIKNLERLLKQEQQENSRLFVVDVASKPEKLNLDKATGQYFIAKGKVRPVLERDYDSDKKEYLSKFYLHYENMSVDNIYVPLSFSKDVRNELKKTKRGKISFQAEVNWGSRWEPWITKFRLVNN